MNGRAICEQYLAGSAEEREEVWQCAMSLDPLDEGNAVQLQRLAGDFLSLVRQNCEQLERNLKAVGYEFRSDNPLVVDSPSSSELDLLPQPVPMLTRAWYACFESLDFRQADSQAGSEGVLGGLGQNCPLYFLSLRESMRFAVGLAEEQESDDFVYWEGRPGRTASFLPTGTWASNSEPKGVYLPDASFDPLLYNDGAGWVTLGGELRNAFRWGGFPRWRRIIEAPMRLPPARPFPDFGALLPELMKGIEPL